MSLPRRFLILFSLFFLKANLLFSQNAFFENYPKAKELVEENYKELELLNQLPNKKGRLIYSIVAPEVAMYKKFMDVFETKTAEIFYTNWGSDYANFSLGIFQMKPSFAEKIENDYTKYYSRGKYIDSLNYNDTAAVEIRSQRIERLKSPQWQQIYLLCFYDIVEKKFGNNISDLKEKISFYAAAYNYGYNSSINEIKEWQKKVSFPGRGEPSLISYSELSVAFLNLWFTTPQPKKEKIEEVVDDSVIFSPEKVIDKKEKRIIKSKAKKKELLAKNGDWTLVIIIALILPLILLLLFLRQKKML